MPLISHRPYTVLERGKITAFLKEPHLKNLPPQIKSGVVNGKVFLCYAPDGQRIFLSTKYKREAIISIRYQNGNVYAELWASTSNGKATEYFLIKEGNSIYHQGKEVDPLTLLGTKKRYHMPKMTFTAGPDSLNKSKKIERGHRIESWLKNEAGVPRRYTARLHKGKKHIQICSYNGEPVLLPLGRKFNYRRARVEFVESGAFKQVIVRGGNKYWEFDLVCEKGKCIVRLISEPL